MHPRLRVAEASDNRALLELTRASPMEAEVSLCFERDPDFFALARARGHGRTLVAELGDRVVACGSVCRRMAYLMGKPGEMGHVADVKVAAQFRRRGLARCIMNEISKSEAEREPAPYVGTVAAGNSATDGMVTRFGEVVPLLRLGSLTSYQLLPFRRFRSLSGLQMGQAEPRDECELVEFLDAYYRRYSFAPVFVDGGFKQLLDRSPGMDLASYRIARRRGRIVAAVAVWNESSVKRSRVHRMNARLRCLSRLVRAAGTVLPLSPFPVEGGLLRFVHLRHPAYEDGAIDALAGLVRSALNEIRMQRLHFAAFACQDGDPIAQCIRGIARTRYRYDLFAGSNVPVYARTIARFRGTPVYDDAALS